MSNLLLIIGLFLMVLWLIAIVTSTTFGGFVYVALVIGAVLLIFWFVRQYGR